MLGCFLLAGALTTQQRALDFGGPLRLWLWRREEERMRSRDRYPPSLRRAYWSDREYRRDTPRLQALGYVIAAEVTSPMYEELSVAPTRGMAPRRRVPAFLVTFERRDAGDQSDARQVSTTVSTSRSIPPSAT